MYYIVYMILCIRCVYYYDKLLLSSIYYIFTLINHNILMTYVIYIYIHCRYI